MLVGGYLDRAYLLPVPESHCPPKDYSSLIVVALPFSGRFWAEGFLDMKQDFWQEGQAHAFCDLKGVPRMLVPDSGGTATERSSIYVTLINKEYERFAEHYGAAIVPARVKKPRDKSTCETAVGIAEQWIVVPAQEMQFHSLEEFNEWCLERVCWLNACSFSAKEGSRDSVYEDEERRLHAAASRPAVRALRVAQRKGRPRLPYRGRLWPLRGPAQADRDADGR